jgi:hypothetical protein
MDWLNKLGDSLANAGASVIDGFAESEVEKMAPEPVNTANIPAQATNDANTKFSDVAALAAFEKQKADAAAKAEESKPFLDKYGKYLAIGGGSFVVLVVLVMAMKGGRKR